MTTIHNKNKNIKIAVGLSGGVDSSVAAYLLKKDGYDITGVYLQCWDSKADLPAQAGGCTAEEDRASAVSVAATLDIPFVHLNYVAEYKQKVISYFYAEYRKGRTPNPDILCNTEIKFGLFLDWALQNGFDYVATGHYAKVENGLLYQGADESKDQSYFLYRLPTEKLQKVLLPLGNLQKEEVRQIAQEANLPTFNRPDSQGICFIGKVDIRDFLQKEIKPQKGELVFKDGNVVGDHDGVWFYTIGQRHGFRVTKYFGLPLYVIGKNVEENKVIVGFTQDVLQTDFSVSDVAWLAQPNTDSFECDVRIRHLGSLHKSKIQSGTNGSFNVNMDTPTFGIASGQSAVFYKQGLVLGGGIIN